MDEALPQLTGLRTGDLQTQEQSRQGETGKFWEDECNPDVSVSRPHSDFDVSILHLEVESGSVQVTIWTAVVCY